MPRVLSSPSVPAASGLSPPDPTGGPGLLPHPDLPHPDLPHPDLPYPDLPWSEAFSVGDPAMDADHRALVEAINALIRDLATGSLSAEAIRARLEDLIQAEVDHHAREERLLDLIGYPDAAEHRAEHTSLRANLQSLIADRHVLAHHPWALVDQLKEWFVDHVLLQDMRYKTYAQEHSRRPHR